MLGARAAEARLAWIGVVIEGVGQVRKGGGRASAAPFGAAVFVGAALAFLIEPMLARLALPLFGGTPAVWTGSVLFFQAALLAGYLYAHATIRWLGPRRGAALHLAVALVPLAFLPIAVLEGFSPPAEAEPLPWLLGLLLASAGVPFFVASATSTLMQGWLAATDHPSAKDPYFLYGASNLGSILGLLGYPLLLEPALGLEAQGLAWAAGYALLFLLLVACAATLWRSPRAAEATTNEAAVVPTETSSVGDGASSGPSSAPSPTLPRRLRWLALGFVPSSLMLGVTAFITTDVAPFPLLWAVPLALYLGSFVVVFSPSPRVLRVSRAFSARALPVAMVGLVVLVLIGVRSPFWAVTGLHLAGFFVAALALHGELAADRPHPRHLTGFYAWIAAGGLLGGVFNALVAPLAFDSVVEYPLAIVLACFFLTRFSSGGQNGVPALPWLSGPRVLDVALPLVVGLWVAAILWISGYADEDGRALLRSGALSVGLGLCLVFAYSTLGRRPARFALGLGAVALAGGLVQAGDGEARVLYAERSFFGAYRVEAEGDFHRLMNGTTLHGAQDLGDDPPVPLFYYDPEGPAGQITDAARRGSEGNVGLRQAAVVGLGAGAMACHAEGGERWTFYEVDPVVERIARDPRLFTYLGECPGEHDVVLGDARLSMQRAPDAAYGLIAVDAFSSDAIPTHLLTREALGLYLRKLGDGGLLALHVSNRHLDLEPVLGNLAQDAGLVCRVPADEAAEEVGAPGANPRWVVMARNTDDLGPLNGERGWRPCPREPGSAPWTDDHSNPLEALR